MNISHFGEFVATLATHLLREEFCGKILDFVGNELNTKEATTFNPSYPAPVTPWLNLSQGSLSGVYGQGKVPHPCQDTSFPFLYDPLFDEYIGFRWDYGDCGPMPPALSTEVIQSLTGLFLSPTPLDYHCAHSAGWDARFTVVWFKKPLVYPAMVGAYKAARLIAPYSYDLGKVALGAYVPYALHPGAESLRTVGYEAIYTPEDTQCPAELFLFSPKTQVTRTLWTEWKN